MSPVHLLLIVTTGLWISPIKASGVVVDPGTKPMIVELRSADVPDGAASFSIAMQVDEDDADHQGVWKARVKSHDLEPGGPWLGVQFGPVPKPLAAHLGIESSQGQMVMNVITGSPADAAGMQQFDVIVNIDGVETSGDIDTFLETVRGFEVGENHNFSLIRGGKPTQVNVTVGSRPDLKKDFDYKFDLATPEVSRGRLFQRGGIIHKDDDGHWSFNRLDDLDDMKNIWQFMPHLGDDDIALEWHGLAPGAGNVFELHVEKGKNVTIKVDDDGRITVTKTEREDGNETTNTFTYENAEAFEKADPETFKLYRRDLNHTPQMQGLLGLHGKFGKLHMIPDIDIDLDIDNLHESLKDAREQFEEAMKAQGHTLDDLKDHMNMFKWKSKDGPAAALLIGRAKTSFSVDTDGTIRVTTRRGGDELVENYENADALKEARPKLYEKYQSLKDAQLEGTEEL
ncbi:MAG: S1C family serine protease [Phycisphaerae bacterium]